MPKGIDVNQNLLKVSIDYAERNGPLDNRTKLYFAVANVYNKHKRDNMDRITPSVVGLRIKKWEMEVKTPVGGRSRKEIFAHDPEVQESLKEMRENLQQNGVSQYLHLVDQIAEGSLEAATHLHCLECCGYMINEIANCGCIACPKWPFRPYQDKASSEDTDKSELDFADEDEDEENDYETVEEIIIQFENED